MVIISSIICINNGYWQVKSSFNQIFKSRITELDCDLQAGNNCDILHFSGKTYLVGEGKINQDFDKTDSIFTKILILNMLARFTNYKESYHVLLTTPPLLYAEQKILLPNYLIGSYEIIHNGINKNITIDKVDVYPETAIALLSNNINELKRYHCLFCDCGGLTFNAIYFKNNNFTSDSILTIRKGMYHIDHVISQFLNKKEYHYNFSYSDIEHMRNTNHSLLEKYKKEINSIIKGFAEDIKTEFDNKGWNVNLCDKIVLLGGGSFVLYEFFKSIYGEKVCFSNDPIYDNIKSLEVIKYKLESQNKQVI